MLINEKLEKINMTKYRLSKDCHRQLSMIFAADKPSLKNARQEHSIK